MNKSKLSIFIDSLFFSIISLVITFGWFNKITKSAKLSIFISNIVSFLLFCIILFFQLKKYKSKKSSSQEKQSIAFFKNYLTYCSKYTSDNFFESLLKSKSILPFVFESDNLLFYINIKRSLYANDFIEANDIFLIKNKPLIFIADKTDESFDTLFKNSPTNFYMYSFDDLYSIIKTKNMFPTNLEKQENFNFKKLPSKAKNHLSKILTKDKFKNFCLSGISLIAFSFFVPYSILYLISGTLLLSFSIACLFGKKQIKTSKQSLEELIKK